MHTPTPTHTLTITRKDSDKIPTVFDCIFSIFDSFHFVNCGFVKNLPETQRSQSKFPGIKNINT